MYFKKSIEAFKLQESRESLEKNKVESLPSFINLTKDSEQDFKFVRKFIKPCGDDLTALKALVSESSKDLFFDLEKEEISTVEPKTNFGVRDTLDSVCYFDSYSRTDGAPAWWSKYLKNE